MAKDNPTVIQEAVLTKEMLTTIVARSVHDVISSHTSVFVEYRLLAQFKQLVLEIGCNSNCRQ